ncbi:MAG TPA: DUF2269 domain-containing protein [Xanthobacteraceae bacterium]|nr:DUF2269 domain-containing protein [Xanthobacteraceae bacterium]
MIDGYLALKFIHIVSSAVLFGTGLGIAFFMWMAHRSGDARAIAHTVRTVVTADAVFTATAAVVQLTTGVALAALAGFSLRESWLVAALVLYVFVGVCWLPVVWIQLRLRDLAQGAIAAEAALSARYRQLFGVWFWLGWPAFIGVLVIFALMIWKPALW